MHTPGPWKAVSAAACAEIEVMEIAEVAHMRVIPARGGWPPAGDPEDDARMLAAAPELLEVLCELTEAAESMIGTCGCIRGKTPEDDDTHTHEAWAEDFLSQRLVAAQAAIKKARGEA